MEFRKNLVQMDPLAAMTTGAEIAELHPGILDKLKVDSGSEAALPWQPIVALVSLQDSVSGKEINLLVKKDDFYTEVLDGTNAPIYRMHEKAGFNLNGENANAYSDFFFSYIAGRHGKFDKIDEVSDMLTPPDDTDNPSMSTGHDARCRQTFAECEALIKPKLVSSDDDTVVMEQYLVFKSGLFKANVTVSSTGDLTLSDEICLKFDLELPEKVHQLDDVGLVPRNFILDDKVGKTQSGLPRPEHSGDAHWTDESILRRAEFGKAGPRYM